MVTLVTKIPEEKDTAGPVATVPIVLVPEPNRGRERVPVTVTVPGSVRVELEEDVSWTVELDTDELWTRPLTFTPGTALLQTLEVWPAGIVTGRLRGEDESSPGELTVGFTPSGGLFPLAPDTSRCRVDGEARFRCVVPLGEQYDLRFKAPRHVPSYQWAHRVEPTSDVGDVVLRKGGSISGYVAREDLPQREGDLRITVRPSISPRETPDGVLAESAMIYRGPSGFFSTSPIRAGVYDLLVEVPGRGVAAVAALQVREGLEARLPRPLVLEPRVPVTIRINPAQPPNGPAWEIELLRAGPEGTRPVRMARASRDGIFAADNLVSGQYFVIVRDGSGSRWGAQPLTVTPEAGELLIQLQSVYVEGSLRRGGETLAGTIWFGGQDGTPSVRFDVDDRGVFRGMLPRAGDWTVDVAVPPGEDAISAAAEVTLDEETNVARADVRIPDTIVEGVVVDTSGDVVAQADVVFHRGPRRLGTARTTADGRFIARSLEPGAAEVIASATGARSAVVNITVDDGPMAPLRLVVHSLEKLESRVVGPGGPVPGARVAIWPEDGGRVSLTVTDSEGYFSAMGHPPTLRLLIAAHSPGHALYVAAFAPDVAQHPKQIALSSATGVIEIEAEAPVSFIEHQGLRIPLPLVLRLLAPAASGDREMRSVRLRELPPGQYRVCSQNPGDAVVTCDSGFLAPGATLQLRVGTAGS